MASYADVVLADAPVAYWRLDDAGTTALDLGPNNLTGTITGGVTTRVPGAVRGSAAMTFNGTTGKVETTASATLPLVVTIEAWVKALNIPGERFFFSANLAGATGDRVILGLAAVGSVIYGAGVSGFVSIDIDDGQWHQHVWVLDGSTVAFYIDGVLRKSSAFARTVVTVSRISLGCHGGSFFPGALDEVAIYPTALTAPQIAAHYAARNNGADWVGSGGVRVSGAALHGRQVVGTGGLRASGTAAMRTTTSRVASGGVQVSGAAVLGRGVVGTGGLRISGAALLGLAIVAKGGVRVGGYAVAHGPVTVRIQGDVTLHRVARAGVRVQRTVAGPVTIGRGALSEAA